MPVERDYVFPELHAGMDHEHYDWSPLNGGRAVLRWPENARVALCVIVTLEHMEWSRPPNSYQIPNLAGGYGQSPFPDVTAWSHREYGHRVGIFRVLKVLDKHGIKPTMAMDVLTAENYPFLVRNIRENRLADRAVPVFSAVSDAAGTLKFFSLPGEPTQSSLYYDQDGVVSTVVQCESLMFR